MPPTSLVGYRHIVERRAEWPVETELLHVGGRRGVFRPPDEAASGRNRWMERLVLLPRGERHLFRIAQHEVFLAFGLDIERADLELGVVVDVDVRALCAGI